MDGWTVHYLSIFSLPSRPLVSFFKSDVAKELLGSSDPGTGVAHISEGERDRKRELKYKDKVPLNKETSRNNPNAERERSLHEA